MSDYEFELVQDDMVVASVSARSYGAALRETLHYVAQYEQDGPLTINEVKRTPISLDRVRLEVTLYE